MQFNEQSFLPQDPHEGAIIQTVNRDCSGREDHSSLVRRPKPRTIRRWYRLPENKNHKNLNV